MSFELSIRASLSEDLPQLKTNYREGFPDEDLFPLVLDLIELDQIVMSLVILLNRNISGHILFTRCEVGQTDVLLLGPLVIKPEAQKRGLGSKLVRDGMKLASAAFNTKQILVLGDPNYYGRFGFEAESNVVTPFPIPELWKPAWQSLSTDKSAQSSKGKLQVPQPWQKPELWSE